MYKKYLEKIYSKDYNKLFDKRYYKEKSSNIFSLKLEYNKINNDLCLSYYRIRDGEEIENFFTRVSFKDYIFLLKTYEKIKRDIKNKIKSI